MVDYSLIQPGKRPQVDLAGGFERAQLGHILGNKESLSPEMQQYGRIDPVAALKMQQGLGGKGKGMTDAQAYRYGREKELFGQAEKIATALDSLEADAIRIIQANPDVTVLGEKLSPLYTEMGRLRNAYNRVAKRKWESQASRYIDQRYAETKEGRAVGQDKRDDVKFAQETDRATIKAFLDRYKKKLSSLLNVGAALPWAARASKGDPLAAKNFMAALSRAGSDEALSDSERDLLEFADVGNKIEALVDKYVVTGQQFSAETLKGAYNSAANVMNKSGGEMDKLLDELSKSMKSQQGKNIVKNYKFNAKVPTITNWEAAFQGQGGDVAPAGTNVNQTNKNQTNKDPKTTTKVQKDAKKRVRSYGR